MMIITSEFADALDELAHKWANKLFASVEDLKGAIDCLKDLADEAENDYVVIQEPTQKDAA